jgi:hypothetical protein
MAQYGFALRGQLPPLPAEDVGLVQVKYNGMLSILVWDEQRGGYVAWSPRGRCYYSTSTRHHPVAEYFNVHLGHWHDLVFLGETYVVRRIAGTCYMTPFNESMSVIKNPRSMVDVTRIQCAIFDYVRHTEGAFVHPFPRYLDRFAALQRTFRFPVGCDHDVVHLPDFLDVPTSFDHASTAIQAFWNEYIGTRGFEGLVLHTREEAMYKVKFRDTLDVAIIAFRLAGNDRPVCGTCGARFDVFWLRHYVSEGRVKRADWFDPQGRLHGSDGGSWVKRLLVCPLCGGRPTLTAGPILGAKIALMTPQGNFLDVADGAQLSPLSSILELIEPLYEEDGYLWVRPEVVVEVAYQQLYVDRPRPLYQYKEGRYVPIGMQQGISLRPYRPRLREDKTVNPRDLRLEQVHLYVDRTRAIQAKWERTRHNTLLA